VVGATAMARVRSLRSRSSSASMSASRFVRSACDCLAAAFAFFSASALDRFSSSARAL
jgi:hypothetical protein